MEAVSLALHVSVFGFPSYAEDGNTQANKQPNKDGCDQFPSGACLVSRFAPHKFPCCQFPAVSKKAAFSTLGWTVVVGTRLRTVDPQSMRSLLSSLLQIKACMLPIPNLACSKTPALRVSRAQFDSRRLRIKGGLRGSDGLSPSYREMLRFKMTLVEIARACPQGPLWSAPDSDAGDPCRDESFREGTYGTVQGDVRIIASVRTRV